MMESLQSAYAELSRIDKIKSNFISIASHELRTPLFHILGYAEMLEQDAEGESAENLQRVLKSARLLQSLVEDMTNMNMLEARSQELEKEKVAIQDILLDTYQEIAPSAEDKNISTDLSLPKESLIIMGDTKKLKYIFLGVLKNAVQYTREGGEINTRIDLHQDCAHIQIQDTGVGIPPKQLEAIFDRFRQIEEHLIRSYGGLGLGLSIARGLVELHDGKIWAESEGKNKGTTIHITLPLAVTPPFITQ
jgi:signal transduction histidine kinase